MGNLPNLGRLPKTSRQFWRAFGIACTAGIEELVFSPKLETLVWDNGYAFKAQYVMLTLPSGDSWQGDLLNRMKYDETGHVYDQAFFAEDQVTLEKVFGQVLASNVVLDALRTAGVELGPVRTPVNMVNIGFIGAGGVGSELLRQISLYNARNATSLPIVAILTSKHLLTHTPTPTAPGLDLSSWKEDVAKAPENGLFDGFVEHLKKNQPAIVVDCTASEHVASLYPSLLTSGLHIATPNKKAFSGPLSLFHQIRSLTHPADADRIKKYPLCYHESSVGAGLPVLSTIEDLVRTGDKVTRIEGVFSGTLSYIFNIFSPTAPPTSGHPPTFSSTVATARDLGYTEPDPRDDLNGLDMG
ncbi:hypothetical protein HDU93_003584, partial [Gonapodya sp. JEL0774]